MSPAEPPATTKPAVHAAARTHGGRAHLRRECA